MSDLDDLAGEILFRVPLTSLTAVRSTCRNWNALSKNQIVGKRATSSKQFIVFVLMGFRVHSMKFELQRIHNDVNMVDPSIKQVSIFDQVKISKVLHCHGLLLCVVEDENRVGTYF
ncbi:unnamed protein product [Microthlaspi erraticum]|uniref:F-box domain-containing protein n=1 Tax=Microthlaspi erraticum TaxID=1685480 RepID=A0A6D2K3W6_9BRAS|nr:unnamed protein product [Microthlaspi erraticum]